MKALKCWICWNRNIEFQLKHQCEICSWCCFIISLVRDWMVERHTLRWSPSVWSRELFLFFSVFLAEKPPSHRYNVGKEISASIALFVMMQYSFRMDNQNPILFVDWCFSFSPLSFLISVSWSSTAIIISTDSHTLVTNGFLIQSKDDASSDRKYFSMFLLSSDKLCKI